MNALGFAPPSSQTSVARTYDVYIVKGRFPVSGHCVHQILEISQVDSDKNRMKLAQEIQLKDLNAALEARKWALSVDDPRQPAGEKDNSRFSWELQLVNITKASGFSSENYAQELTDILTTPGATQRNYDLGKMGITKTFRIISMICHP